MKYLSKYIRGQISAQELEETTNQLLQAKFENDAKRKWALALEKEHGIKRKPAGNIKRLYWLSATAVAVFLLALLWPPVQNTFRPSYEKTAEAYLALRFPAHEIRKGGPGLEATRMEAIDAYLKGDYQKGIALRKVVAESPSGNSSDHFYLGLSYLYIKKPNPQLAIEHLVKAQQMDKGRLQQEINWFLSLAYIKNQELDKAREMLQEITKNKGWNADKAEKLLLELTG